MTIIAVVFPALIICETIFCPRVSFFRYVYCDVHAAIQPQCHRKSGWQPTICRQGTHPGYNAPNPREYHGEKSITRCNYRCKKCIGIPSGHFFSKMCVGILSRRTSPFFAHLQNFLERVLLCTTRCVIGVWTIPHWSGDRPAPLCFSFSQLY